MTAVIGLVSSLAVLAWMSAAVHAIMLISHRRPDVTVLQLALGGHRFFLAQTFTDAGKALHRRFLLSVLVFAVCVVAAMGVGALLAALGT